MDVQPRSQLDCCQNGSMLEDLNVLTCDGQGYSESSPKNQLPENGGLGNQSGPSGCRQNARLRCVCVFAESWTNCCVSFTNPADQFSWFGLKFCGELGKLTAALCERLLCCVLKKKGHSPGIRQWSRWIFVEIRAQAVKEGHTHTRDQLVVADLARCTSSRTHSTSRSRCCLWSKALAGARTTPCALGYWLWIGLHVTTREQELRLPVFGSPRKADISKCWRESPEA